MYSYLIFTLSCMKDCYPNCREKESRKPEKFRYISWITQLSDRQSQDRQDRSDSRAELLSATPNRKQKVILVPERPKMHGSRGTTKVTVISH